MDASEKRKLIVRDGKFRLIHWGVLVLSLVATLMVYSFTKGQVEDKERKSFLKEADQVIEMISERMEKYEDALWGGQSCIQSHGGQISRSDWAVFSNHIRIDQKYPGINGIGVIYNVKKENLYSFVLQQQKDFPEYKIYPIHDEEEYWPITYIQPVDNNYESIGLDMAHEENRYTAVKKARDTGEAQITGPIVLVQDAEKSSGFLFFVPIYDGPSKTLEDRRKNIVGVVYSPFMVRKLMDGTLQRDKRHVDIKIFDGDEIIYSESREEWECHCPIPPKRYDILMHGRTWTFEIQPSASFHEGSNNQPLIILFGGLFIDLMLLVIFLKLIRTNKRAINFTEMASKELKLNNNKLSQRNQDLETLLHISSHDLREPLRAIKNFSKMANEKYKDDLDDKGKDLLFRIERGAGKMDILLDDILSLSCAQRKQFHNRRVDSNILIGNVIEDMDEKISNSNAKISIPNALPILYVDEMWASRAFYNLISNAIKFAKPGERPDITISTYRTQLGTGITISDRGIGVRKASFDRIFNLFQRDVGKEIGGTGAGLAIVRQVALRHNGNVWVNPRDGGGSSFTIVFSNEEDYVHVQKD